MVLLIEDSFNRADSTTTLGSTNGAGSLDPIAWVPQLGTWGINGNASYTVGNPSPGIATIETGFPNVDVQVKLSTILSTTQGVVFRFSDTANYLYAVVDITGNLNIVKRQADVQTTLITKYGFLQFDILRVTAINNVITVYKNGVSFARVIEKFNRSATKCGIYAKDNTGFRLDDFSVRTVAVPAELTTDSFDRLDSTSLGNTDGVGSLDPLTWGSTLGYLSDIVSNTARPGASPTFLSGLPSPYNFSSGINLNFIDALTPDVQIFMTQVSNAGGSGTGIIFRYVDQNNYWAFMASAGDQTRLFKQVAGVWTAVSGVLSGVLGAASYNVKISGSTIICEVNGIEVVRVNDTYLDNATKHGFITSWSGPGPVDNFQLWEGEPAIPVIAQVGPAQGVSSGGTDVTIAGNNFTGATGVSFGATPATSFTVISDKYIEAISPAHAPASLNITVTNADGSSVIGTPGQYSFFQPEPLVSSVTPTNGPPAGGTSVVITGAYFTGATSVKFGTTEATSFVVNNDGQITAVAPAHASGVIPIIITTPQGSNG